jgi:hypothetical protein
VVKASVAVSDQAGFLFISIGPRIYTSLAYILI